MEFWKRVNLALYLNGALGSGKYEIGVAQVKEQILEGTIFRSLEERLSDCTDFSVLLQEDRAVLLDEWEGLVCTVDESRKLCVENDGLCLLVAYMLAGIDAHANEVGFKRSRRKPRE